MTPQVTVNVIAGPLDDDQLAALAESYWREFGAVLPEPHDAGRLVVELWDGATLTVLLADDDHPPRVDVEDQADNAEPGRDTSGDPTHLCRHCFRGVYLNRGARKWLHSGTGAELCQWRATPGPFV